jgi:2',3'-cyclic-nucleotide 2'-phosphodiesterase (5'-nucleotidase family)
MKKSIFLVLIIALFFSCKKEQIQVKKITGKQIAIDTNYAGDTLISNFIEPYKLKLKDEINRVLCYNPKTLTREETDLESSLGNAYADICFEKADSIFQAQTGKTIDFALFNFGGIRTVIPKGDITVKNLFELMPFENMLVIAELSGNQTQELFNYLEKRKEAHPISHLKIALKGEKLTDIRIQNKPFDSKKNYYVLTHDYLQHGGDNMSFFKNPIYLFNTQLKVRDALIEHLSTIDTLKVSIDNRFIQIN